MTRTSLFSCLAILALGPTLVACGESHVDDPDAGPVDSGAVEVDAFVPAVDSGVDAGQDSGPTAMDAGLTPRDGSLLPPSDAGDPFGDAGTLGTPPWTTIDVLTGSVPCEPLVPCGGDEEGTWDVGGGCIHLDLSMLDACPGAMVRSATGRGRGRVTFDGTTARRVAQSEIELEIFVPTLCASFLGGCPGIEERVREQVAEAVCVMEADGCACAGRDGLSIDDADAYTIEGDEIVSSTGKRWAYCVDGTDMRYEDVSPDTVTLPREMGIIDLTRR